MSNEPQRIGTTETTELLVAAAGFVHDLAKHAHDGKLSQIAVMAGDVPSLVKGLIGADKVPEELEDLDMDETSALYDAVAEKIGEDAEDPKLKRFVTTCATATAALAAAVKQGMALHGRKGK